MFTTKTHNSMEKEKKHLALELSEIKDISGIIFKRIENKIEALSALEASVDKKIASLERLMNKTADHDASSDVVDRQHEVIALKDHGLDAGDISEILEISVAEIELILEVHGQRK